MKQLLLMLVLGFTSQAQAGDLFKTACIDRHGGTYITERAFCYNSPGCSEVSQDLVCQNNKCITPTFKIEQIEPMGPAASVGGRDIVAMVTELNALTQQNPDMMGSGNVFVARTEAATWIVCAPAMMSSDFKAAGVEAKLKAHLNP